MLHVLITASSRYPIRRRQIKEVVALVLSEMNISSDIEVEINIIGDRKMTQLHVKHLHEPGTTDVLSFPLNENLGTKDKFVSYPDKTLRLGTIFISYPQARRQANKHKLLVDQEVAQLVEHGMFHLLGIHHE